MGVGGLVEYTEGHPEGRGCHVGLRVHHSPVGRRDFDWTCPGDVGNNRWIVTGIRNTRSPPSKNSNMSATGAELHKQPLCPPNEDEQ